MVFGVIIGTGTGGGIRIDKKVLEGVNSIVGEWGHKPLPWTEKEEEVKCFCGKFNCIETFLSGPGFVNRYKILGGKEDTPISILDKEGLKDPIARKALEKYYIHLAKALSGIRGAAWLW